MSTEWELPGWAEGMDKPPKLVTYSGHVRLAIPWEGSTSRRRFTITVDRTDGVGWTMMDLNVAQAEALRDMLDNALSLAAERDQDAISANADAADLNNTTPG